MCRTAGRRCPGSTNPTPEARAASNARRRETRRYRRDLIDAARERGGDELAREVAALPASAYPAVTQALGMTPEEVSDAVLASGGPTHPVPDLTALAEATAGLRRAGDDTSLLDAVTGPQTPPCTVDPLAHLPAYDRDLAASVLARPEHPAPLAVLNNLPDLIREDATGLDVVAEAHGGDMSEAVRELAGRAATGDADARELLLINPPHRRTNVEADRNRNQVIDAFSRASLLGDPIPDENRANRDDFRAALFEKYAAGTPPTDDELADFARRWPTFPLLGPDTEVPDDVERLLTLDDARIEAMNRSAYNFAKTVRAGREAVEPDGTPDVEALEKMDPDQARQVLTAARYSGLLDDDEAAVAWEASGHADGQDSGWDVSRGEDTTHYDRAAGVRPSRTLHGATGESAAAALLSDIGEGHPVREGEVAWAASRLAPGHPDLARLADADGGRFAQTVDEQQRQRDAARVAGLPRIDHALLAVDGHPGTGGSALEAVLSENVATGTAPVSESDAFRLGATGGSFDALAPHLGEQEKAVLDRAFTRGAVAAGSVDDPASQAAADAATAEGERLLGQSRPSREKLYAAAQENRQTADRYLAQAMSADFAGDTDRAAGLYGRAEAVRTLGEALDERAAPAGQRPLTSQWSDALSAAGLGTALSGAQAQRTLNSNRELIDEVVSTSSPRRVLELTGHDTSTMSPAQITERANEVRAPFTRLRAAEVIGRSWDGKPHPVKPGKATEGWFTRQDTPARTTLDVARDLPEGERNSLIDTTAASRAGDALRVTGGKTAAVTWDTGREIDSDPGFLPRHPENNRVMALPGDRLTDAQADEVVNEAWGHVEDTLGYAAPDTGDEAYSQAYTRFEAAAQDRLRTVRSIPDPDRRWRAAHDWAVQTQEIIESGEWEHLPATALADPDAEALF